MSVLAPSIGIWWRIIESYGLDPDPYFRAEGLDVVWPIEPGTRVAYDAIDRARAHAARDTGDPDFGLRTAALVHPSHIGALGYAVLASSSLLNSFQRMHRFIRVVNDDSHFDIEDRGNTFVVSLSVNKPSANARVRDDGMMAYAVALSRLNAGPETNPSHVSFSLDRPADIQAYDALFRCPVHFGSEHNEIGFSKKDAERQLPSANPVLAQMHDRIVIRRLASLDRDNIPNRARAAIMAQLPSGHISDETVASALNMTSRTLNRKLKVEGLSFRSILQDVRQDLARQYIEDASLTLTEITFLLGFSEMSSFSRAFKNWTGQSPSAARAADDEG
ncbi:AraC family transcriptional regulator [Marinihelvus fidelis]|nr:AraC family transcriptional regulator [Marinihelvus fidelis]